MFAANPTVIALWLACTGRSQLVSAVSRGRISNDKSTYGNASRMTSNSYLIV